MTNGDIVHLQYSILERVVVEQSVYNRAILTGQHVGRSHISGEFGADHYSLTDPDSDGSEKPPQPLSFGSIDMTCRRGNSNGGWPNHPGGSVQVWPCLGECGAAKVETIGAECPVPDLHRGVRLGTK